MTPRAGLATVLPRYGESSLADVMPSVLASLGVPGAADALGLSTGPLADVQTVVVLLVDGLGHHLLPLAAPHAPGLAMLSHGPYARILTTGFPSTTPTSLATFGTGAAAGAHGLVGFTLNIPGTERLLNHIEWHGDPDPFRWQPLDTQFERASAAGVATYVVSRREFEGTGLTRAAFRGGAYLGADDSPSAANAILDVVNAASGRTVVYSYHREVDKEGHRFGVDSPQWRLAVADVDRLVTVLAERLPPHAVLLVTADHGQVNIPAEHRFDLDTDPRLRAGIRIVAGESRVRYLHTVDGARDDVIAAWRGVLGDAAWVASRDEAVAEGWFGPIPEAHLRRVGDVVVACHCDYLVLATKTDPPVVAKLVGAHGSATEAEMMIPLLAVSGRS